MDPLNGFLFGVYSNAFGYVEILFAFLAAISFLVFLRGWLGGIGNVIKMNGHDEHLNHAYVRQVWGVMLLAALFFVWEVVRMVASWFGLVPAHPTTHTWAMLGIAAVVAAYVFIKKNLFSDSGGH